MDFIQSLLTLLTSIVESPEFRTFVISLFSVGAAWLLLQRTRLKLKSDAEQKQAETAAALDLKLQERVRQVELEKQEQINASIEVFRDLLLKDREQFQRERTTLEQQVARLETAVGDWQRKHDAREKEIKAFIEQQSTDAKRIEALEADKRQRDEQIATLTRRITTIETDRDDWKGLAEQRDGELKKRDETIARQEGEIKTLSDKVEALQKQVNALEKKTDTGQLDGAKAPVESVSNSEVAKQVAAKQAETPGATPEKE